MAIISYLPCRDCGNLRPIFGYCQVCTPEIICQDCKQAFTPRNGNIRRCPQCRTEHKKALEKRRLKPAEPEPCKSDKPPQKRRPQPRRPKEPGDDFNPYQINTFFETTEETQARRVALRARLDRMQHETER